MIAIGVVGLVVLSGCAHREGAVSGRKAASSQALPGQVEVASLVGTWATALPDNADEVAEVELTADEHWKFWPPERSGYINPKRPNQSGTWFVRNGKVFLLVEQSESDKIVPGMAFAFEIKSASLDRAVVLWSGQEMRFKRIR